MRKILIFLLFGAGAAYAGPSIRPCTLEEQAAIGANFAVTIAAADLEEDSADTAEVLDLLPVEKGRVVQFVAMRLLEDFGSAQTAATHSCKIKIGDSNVTDRFLAETELAGDSGAVWFSLGKNAFATPTAGPIVSVETVTLNKTLTEIVYKGESDDLVTNSVCTAVSLDVTLQTNEVVNALSVAAGYAFATNTTVDFTFTPNSEYSLKSFTKGRVELFFKIHNVLH